MNWIQLLGAVGIGAIVVKLLDIFWLQQLVQENEHLKWLKEKRFQTFTTLSKELISFGLHGEKLKGPFETFATVADALLLIEDNDLIDRIDQFLVKLEKMNRSINNNEDKKTAEHLYQDLTNESRKLIKELRNILLKPPPTGFQKAKTGILNLTHRLKGQPPSSAAS